MWLTLRYTAPDIHCRDGHCECDGGMNSNLARLIIPPRPRRANTRAKTDDCRKRGVACVNGDGVKLSVVTCQLACSRTHTYPHNTVNVKVKVGF